MGDGGGFEIEHGHAEYSAAELLEQAQANAQAMVIATAAFLQERGVPVEEWAEALGRTFARGWDEPRPWDAGEFMDAMLTNYRAMGAEPRFADLGAERAEAATTGFPDPDLCAVLGVEVALAARFNDAAAAIARDRGLTWTWALDGEQTRYRAERAKA
jgi:hypothetical protein